MDWEPKHIPNPLFDPTKADGEDGNLSLIIDPRCDVSRWYCENVALELEREEFLEGEKEAFWRTLDLIATHAVAPPSWLCDAMHVEFAEKVAGRKNSATRARLQQVRFSRVRFADKLAMETARRHKAGLPSDPKLRFSLDALADHLHLSPSALDRLIRQAARRTKELRNILAAQSTIPRIDRTTFLSNRARA